MKHVFSVFFAAALTAAFAAGCAGAQDQKAEQDKASSAPASEPPPAAAPAPAAAVQTFPARHAEAARKLAEKPALGMAEAIKTGDLEKFNSTLPQKGRPMTQAAFKKQCRMLSARFGKLVGTEYLGSIDRGKTRDFLWKFAFEGAPDPKTPQHVEVLYVVKIGLVKDQPTIFGCGIIPY